MYINILDNIDINRYRYTASVCVYIYIYATCYTYFTGELYKTNYIHKRNE